MENSASPSVSGCVRAHTACVCPIVSCAAFLLIMNLLSLAFLEGGGAEGFGGVLVHVFTEAHQTQLHTGP